jgi:hypothetical protein
MNRTLRASVSASRHGAGWPRDRHPPRSIKLRADNRLRTGERSRSCRKPRRGPTPGRPPRTRSCRPVPGAAAASACGPGAGSRCGLNGDCAAGMKKMRWSPTSSKAARATRRCPKCTGSNDPPKSPIRSIIFAVGALNSCARVRYRPSLPRFRRKVPVRNQPWGRRSWRLRGDARRPHTPR